MATKSGKLVPTALLIALVCAVIAGAESVRERLRWQQIVPRAQVETNNLVVVAKKYRLMNLKFRTGRHSTPDAIVYIPAGFDANGALNVVLYNHGLTNNLDEAFDFWRLDQAMQSAPRNSVLILPEWAENPEAYSSQAGDFYQANFFRNMLAEIFTKTPQLQHRKVSDISSLVIATFSGGFRATQTEIHNNGLEDKVKGLVLLDSLYQPDVFNDWLAKNIQDLANGRKFYHNYYFDTKSNSLAQLSWLRRLIAEAGLPAHTVFHQGSSPKDVVPASVTSRHGIVYVYTTIYSDTYSAHQSAAYLYFPEALKAASIMDGAEQFAGSSDNANGFF